MSKILSKNSLYISLFFVVVSIVIIFMSIQTTYTYFSTKERIIENMQKNSYQTAQSLQNNLAHLIESYSVNEYIKLIHNELYKKDIFAIVVEDFKMGEMVGSSYISGQIKNLELHSIDYNHKDINHQKQLKQCFYSQGYNIKNKENQLIGKMTIYISDKSLNKELQNIILDLIINVIVISLALIVSLIVAIKFIIIRPIANIITVFDKYDGYGLPTTPLPKQGPAEIIVLANTMNSMIKRIREAIEKEQNLKNEIVQEKDFISAQNILLKEQKEEFETIFNYAKDGIAIVDLESNFLDFNDAYLKITGFTREELLTKSCKELTVEEEKEKTTNIIPVIIRDGYIENFEKSCLVKDNRIVTVNMTISLMPDGKRLLVFAKDMTQTKLLESQSKLASMGEMIGNIAHQWRQPLSVINIIASALLFKAETKTLKEDEVASKMETIMVQASYLSKTIDDFRNFIKATDKKSTLNLASVIDKTLTIVKPTLSHNYIKPILDLDATLTIEGFENGLIQSFINIINNAKDAISENIVQTSERYIFITLHKVEDGIELIFKDNAGGIKQEVIEHIFEPYFTTKHQSIGTGIGLSMTYGIITQRHNATIKALNETYEYEGKTYTGACFIVNFLEQPKENN
jgi:PAS domain S-box-containing protein